VTVYTADPILMSISPLKLLAQTVSSFRKDLH
jgi:hypothetical protein